MFQECRCPWCLSFAPPLLQSIGGDRYWFEVPKNASTTIKSHYEYIIGGVCTFNGRVPREEWGELAQRGVAPIVVYRDPIDRFVSLLNHYLYGFQLPTSKTLFYPTNIETLSPQARICGLFDKIPLLSSNHQVHHFHPQVDFVDTETFKNFTLIPMDRVDAEFGIVSPVRHFESGTNITRGMMTAEYTTIIKTLYARDYEFLKNHGVTFSID